MNRRFRQDPSTGGPSRWNSLRKWHRFGYFRCYVCMSRPLLLIAILSLSAGEVLARTNAMEGAPKPPEKRRVLFRTDSPRLFAPSSPKPAERPPAPTPPPLKKPRAATLPAIPTPGPVARIAPPAPLSRTPTKPAAPRPGRDLDLQPTSFTPYDAYLGPVRTVISRLNGRNATMTTACDLVREGRGFRYLVTDPYRAQLPAVTEARHAGDCKSKALWLYDQLGDPGAYYVIGKLERRSRTSHAWVYWRCEGRWWILDPTDRGTPISADSVASHRYVPYYSFSRSGTFRHSATRLMLAMGQGIPAARAEPAIATRSRPIAAPARAQR